MKGQPLSDNPHSLKNAVDEAVNAALDDVGHSLVRPELFAQDTTKLSEQFDLTNVDASKKRELHVQLRMPSKREFLQLTMQRYEQQSGKPDEADLPAIVELLKEVVNPYYAASAAKAWMSHIDHGETTIVFEGVPHDSAHFLNRAYDDIENQRSTAVGMAPNALKAKMPDATNEQVIAANKPANRHQLMAVNDTVLLNYQPKDIDMRKKFGHVVELVEARDALNATEEAQLFPYVKIGTVDGQRSTFNVNNLHQVCSGTGYFDKEDLPPQGAVLAALMHEHYHVINGDFESPAMQHMNKLAKVLPVQAVQVACLASPEASAEAFLQAGGGHTEMAHELLDTMSGHLDAMQAALALVGEHLRATPWINEVDGLKVAADICGENQFQNHVAALPEYELPMKDTAVFMRLAQHVTQKGKEAPYEKSSPEDIANVQMAMCEMFEKHAQLFEDVSAIHKVGTALNHASEFLADVRAAERLENPQDLEIMLRWAQGEGATDRTSFAHPSTDDRGLAIEDYIEAAQQAQKPVIGQATAALAEQRKSAERSKGI